MLMMIRAMIRKPDWGTRNAGMCLAIIGGASPCSALHVSLVTLTAVFLWIVPGNAATVSAQKMNVSIQPEFDDPRVLVIKQADLDPDLQLPADVTFNIPKEAEIGMACEVDPNGGHSCKPYRTTDMGEYQALTFTVRTMRRVFLEYYYEAFPAGSPQRSFDYTFRAGFPAASLTIEVQQPLRSSDFSLSPSFVRKVEEPRGFINHLRDYANIATGKPIQITISYTKGDDRPSIQPKPKNTVAPDVPPAVVAFGGRTYGSGRGLFLLLLGLAGSSFLFFGIYRVFRSPEPAGPGGGSRGMEFRDDGTRGSKDGGGGNNEDKFCSSCGLRIRLEDRFCSRCGNQQSTVEVR